MKTTFLAGTPRCGVTARKAGGIADCGTIERPTTQVARLNAVRTAQYAIPALLCVLAWLLVTQASMPAYSQSIYPSPYTFTTIARTSNTDFNAKSVAVDPGGNVYFADPKKQVICRIDPSGAISIIAGKLGTCGSSDGTGSQARFCRPCGIATDTTGNIYVADTGNNTIRRITPAGVVTTLAGLAGTVGSTDGAGSYARFNFPVSIAADDSGVIYVADLYNCTIRKVTSHGIVTTIAGQAGRFGAVDGRGASALFDFPISIAVDHSTNVYVADMLNNAIRKVTRSGMVITWAGKMSCTPGDADGVGKSAQFCHPCGVAVDKAGNIYVADSGNDIIRRINSDRTVTTLAGIAGQSGFADGIGRTVRFWHPTALAVDCPGNLYVTDMKNTAIRKGSAVILTVVSSSF